jgi:uncharacterized protein YlxW (UPF0749 family)
LGFDRGICIYHRRRSNFAGPPTAIRRKLEQQRETEKATQEKQTELIMAVRDLNKDLAHFHDGIKRMEETSKEILRRLPE